MSHQWSVRALTKISDNEMENVRKLVQTLPFVITHDNVNIPFRVYSQRLDNQSHFDCGTASTVFFQPDAPLEHPLCNRTLQDFRAQGRKSPLSITKIYDLAQAAERTSTSETSTEFSAISLTVMSLISQHILNPVTNPSLFPLSL